MKKQFVTIFILLITIPVFAQFAPGDIGYDAGMHKIYKNNKVHEIISMVSSSAVEDFIKGDTSMVYTYSENGAPLSTKITDLSMAEGDITLHYFWLPDGKLKSSTNDGFDGVPFETKYDYAEGGTLVGTSVVGELPRRDHYIYDLAGHIIERDGEVFQVPVDKTGNATGPAKWMPVDKDLYTWNENGTLKTGIYYSENEIYALVDYMYNENKQLIGVYFYTDETRSASSGRTYFTYTKEGLPATKEEYNGMNDMMVTYQFFVIKY